jgi:hypothetical protein
MNYNQEYKQVCRVPVAHTYNPSYSGGRDQEDRGSKPVGQTIQETLSRKTLSQKIGLVEWLKVKALSSSPNTAKKQKEHKQICQVRVAHAYNPSYLGI